MKKKNENKKIIINSPLDVFISLFIVFSALPPRFNGEKKTDITTNEIIVSDLRNFQPHIMSILNGQRRLILRSIMILTMLTLMPHGCYIEKNKKRVFSKLKKKKRMKNIGEKKKTKKVFSVLGKAKDIVNTTALWI